MSANESATGANEGEASVRDAEALPMLDPVAVFAALGSEVRWPILQRLADGQAWAVTDLAAAFGREADGIGRQLQVLLRAGVVEMSIGEDRRTSMYRIPERYRREPGVLDFGVCRVLLPSM